MQPPTNNNLLAEISALVIASVLILVAGFLRYFGKIDDTLFIGLVASSLTLLGLKAALTAPSAIQQSQLTTLQDGLQQVLASHLQLTAQVAALQAQPQLVQAPAPVAAPQVVQLTPAMSGTTIPPNFTTSYNPPSNVRTGTAGGGMAPAMQTTQTYPAMPPGQPQ